MPARPTRPTALALAATLLLTVGACGDDEDAGDEPTSTTAAEETTASTTDVPEDEAPEDLEITGVDYAFEGVPASVAAGTRLTFANASEVEAHELIAVRLADDETRPVAEIVADPAGIGALLGGGPPTAVLVAAPGGSQPGAVVGDGVLADPGRYALICTIPTGVDPQAYLDAAAAAQGGPPDIQGCPPHVVQGMVAELEVTG